ncbi:protein FAR-RED IMPAIRED RESPONSE 1-like [Silene latifolia]|uniref:protein FAR-RED IMPAIRED RESPONSE 1-like n=1 Tax=Silene latifolia TaxID=37657 RepID=UPI003D775A49
MKQFVTKVKVLKLGGVKAYRGWKELCGGYDNIGATEVDFKNFVRDIKTYIGNFDAQMFVENLIGRKDTCSSFYFDFIVDENKCLARVFWADPICIKNYMLFDEVLSADATYRTNKYDMVFVPFTGVDHHKRCITFGAGLIGDESIECYTWLFKTFLEAMGGSESENSFFDRFLTPHLTLVEFWVCYESALEAQRHKQYKLNSDNKHSEIPRKTKSNLEVHASEIEWACCACTPLDSTQPRFLKYRAQYIKQRWTKAAMTKPVFDKDDKLIDVSQKFFDLGKV